MRALVVDAGNSMVAVARWEGTAAPGPERLTELHRQEIPRGEAAQHAWLQELTALLRQEEDAALVLASVVPRLTATVRAAWPDCVIIDHTLDFPFSLSLEDPAGVGADRFCNVAAAVRAGHHDALVLDLGTATTFDLLLDGDFAGGLIAPGMAFAAQKLGEEAARLQPVPFRSYPLEGGKKTEAAMGAGSYHVAVLGVTATAAALLDRYGDRPVIVTGGLAHHLNAPGWEHQPDWTLQGAAYLGALALTDRRSL